MSDTPLTDAASDRYPNGAHWQELVPADFARNLELQLTETREQLEQALNAVHTCHDQCARPACVLRRQLTEANARVKELEGKLRTATADAFEEAVKIVNAAMVKSEGDLVYATTKLHAKAAAIRKGEGE